MDNYKQELKELLSPLDYPSFNLVYTLLNENKSEITLLLGELLIDKLAEKLIYKYYENKIYIYSNYGIKMFTDSFILELRLKTDGEKNYRIESVFLNSNQRYKENANIFIKDITKITSKEIRDIYNFFNKLVRINIKNKEFYIAIY